MAAVVVDIGADTSAFTREVGRLPDTASRISRGIASSFSGLSGMLAGVGFAYLGKQALETVTGIDRMQRAMTTLEGGTEAAAKRLAQFREDAKLPGVDFRQAVQADIRLRAAGISAETSRNSIIEFGNALSLAGAEAGQLDNVTLALSQIVSRGQVTADNINQIANAVPQIRAVMKDVFGTADTEALQKMNMDAMTFVEGLVQGFSQLDRASAGLDENLADMSTTMAETVNAVAKPIVDELIPAMSNLAEWANRNREAFADMGSNIANVLTSAAEQAGNFAKVIGDTVSEVSLLFSTLKEGGSLADYVDLSQATRTEMLRQESAAAAEAAAAAAPPDASRPAGASRVPNGDNILTRLSSAFTTFAGPMMAEVKNQLTEQAGILKGRASTFAKGAFGGLRGDMDTSFGRGSSINPFTNTAGSQIREMTRQSNLMMKQAEKLDTSNQLLGDIREAVKSFNLVPTYN